MPQLFSESAAARTLARRKAFITLGLLTAVVVLAIVLIPALSARSSAAQSARQPLRVMPLGASTTNDWKLSSRGSLVTDSRTTRILVELTRSSEAEQTPSLTGNFDGSGGGDAKQITCLSKPAKWTVPTGKIQTIALTCNAVVAPTVVKQIHYVYAGKP